jgi:UPF0042 nucleotide-binding protein
VERGLTAERLIVVSGMAGAGRTAALKTLEDLGFEAVNNLPLALLGSLVSVPRRDSDRPLAIGIDIRNRDFAAEALLAAIERLRRADGTGLTFVFLDCDDDELQRRYMETRHRHPLSEDRPLLDGIRHERQVLAPVRDSADLVINTTSLKTEDLGRLLGRHFSPRGSGGLAVSLLSFGYAQGIPHEADLVFDVRFLRNPHYVAELRPLTGRDRAVADYVVEDPGFAPFFTGLTGLLETMLPGYGDRRSLTIALGCTGGRHRSVMVAERLAGWLRQKEIPVELRHRDS